MPAYIKETPTSWQKRQEARYPMEIYTSVNAKLTHFFFERHLARKETRYLTGKTCASSTNLFAVSSVDKM